MGHSPLIERIYMNTFDSLLEATVEDGSGHPPGVSFVGGIYRPQRSGSESLLFELRSSVMML